MINRETGFQVPPIQTQEVQTQTPGIAPAVNQVAGTYGAQLNSRLQNPYMSYADFVKARGGASPTDIGPDSATTSAVQALNSLWGIKSPGTAAGGSSAGRMQAAKDFALKTWGGAYGQNYDAFPQYLKDEALKEVGGSDGTPAVPGSDPSGFNIGDVLNTAPAVDTEAAYGKSLDAANRQFTQYLLPQLLESFGRRGGRYSSAVATAGAKSYGDIQANLGAQAATARIAAEEAAAGRKSAANLGVLNTGVARANSYANIGVGNTALANSNMAKDYQEFLRMQPDAAYGATQGFLGTRPIYPQVITGGQPVLTQNPSQLDAVNQYLNAISNIAPAVSNAANLFR